MSESAPEPHRPDHPRRPGRRLPGDRPGDGPRAQADGLQPRRPAGGGPRRRSLHRRRPRDLRVGHDADAHRLDPGLHPRASCGGWRARSSRATSSSTTTPTTVPRTRPTCASRSRSSGRASSSPGRRRRSISPTPAACSPASPSTCTTSGRSRRSTTRSSSTRSGVRNEQLWQFFVDNTRTPSYVVGDTEAMIAAGRPRREALPRAARALRPRHGARPPSRSSSTTASG